MAISCFQVLDLAVLTGHRRNRHGEIWRHMEDCPERDRRCGTVTVPRRQISLAKQRPVHNTPAPMSGGKATTVKPGTLQRELVVSNVKGIHARPAALFVKTANKFDAQVFVEKDGETVNGKSIMGLMMLAAGPGSRIRLTAEGGDATAALDELEKLLATKFGEQ
jgi:phosphocarrier protein HPr